MSTIKIGEGFTVEQVLNSKGFTLDTTDFPDLLNDDELEANFAESVNLNNQEMLRLLNLDEEKYNEGDDGNNIEDKILNEIVFDSIRPKMHSIHGDGQILKVIMKEGVGEVVPSDAQVTIEYVAFFDGQFEPFDSTLFQNDKQMVLRLGAGNVIPGLEIAVGSMKKYEKAVFLIQPELGYGVLGCPPRILPNAEVLFRVRLKDFLDNGSAELYDDLSIEDRRKFSVVEKIAQDLRKTARDSFNRNKINQAVREYSRAVTYLESASLTNDDEERQMNKLLSRILTNLTVCYNKIGKPKLACASFQRLPEKNGKAYFQYGKAQAQLGEHDEAMKSLQQALRLEPGDSRIHLEIQKVEEKRKKYAEISKQFARNSLRIGGTNRDDKFEQIATEMCETFANDSTLTKQQIPPGLSEAEQECIRRIAASHGLTITRQKRYNVESSFLTKKAM